MIKPLRTLKELSLRLIRTMEPLTHLSLSLPLFFLIKAPFRMSFCAGQLWGGFPLFILVRPMAANSMRAITSLPPHLIDLVCPSAFPRPFLHPSLFPLQSFCVRPTFYTAVDLSGTALETAHFWFPLFFWVCNSRVELPLMLFLWKIVPSLFSLLNLPPVAYH